MVKTSRIPGNSSPISTPRRRVKKKQTDSSKKIKTRAAKTIPKKEMPIPKGHKEYRLVLALKATDGKSSKHQGPRLCSPKRAKLYFSPQARLLLGVWTHNSHLLPKTYSACVTGYTNKNIAHAVTYSMVRSEVAAMISTVASNSASNAASNATSNAASNAANINFKTSLDTLDLFSSTSKKTNQVSRFVDKINPNKLSAELMHEFKFPDKDLQDIGEEFDIIWDIGKESL